MPRSTFSPYTTDYLLKDPIYAAPLPESVAQMVLNNKSTITPLQIADFVDETAQSGENDVIVRGAMVVNHFSGKPIYLDIYPGVPTREETPHDLYSTHKYLPVSAGQSPFHAVCNTMSGSAIFRTKDGVPTSGIIGVVGTLLGSFYVKEFGQQCSEDHLINPFYTSLENYQASMLGPKVDNLYRNYDPFRFHGADSTIPDGSTGQ